MDKKWWTVGILAFVIGAVASITGFLTTQGFGGNFLAEVAGLAFAFVLALWLIEGPLLTRENRRRRVTEAKARSVVALSEEIGLMLSREIAQRLTTEVETYVDLYGEESGEWETSRVLMRQVFEQAQRGSLSEYASLDIDEYRSMIDASRSLVQRFNTSFGSDLDVRAMLWDLVRAIQALERYVTEASYPYVLNNESRRFQALAAVGDAIVDVVQAGPRIEVQTS